MSLLIFLLGILNMTQTRTLEQKLNEMQGKNRIILLYAPQPNDTAYLQQKRWLSDNKSNLLERDLVIIDCVANQLSDQDTRYLAAHFSYKPNQFGLWLIGKDGGTKLSTQQATPPQQIFDLIDTMPMRRAEMRPN
jgi:hypothetical protein